MANYIQIRRSNTSLTPANTLVSGELAYSYPANTLYIGAQTGTSGVSFKIGGAKYVYLDRAQVGNLTANASVVLDGNGFISNTFTSGLIIGGSADQTSNTYVFVNTISDQYTNTMLGSSQGNNELVTANAIAHYVQSAVLSGGVYANGAPASGANGALQYNDQSSGFNTIAGADNLVYDKITGTLTVGNTESHVHMGYITDYQATQENNGNINSYIQGLIRNANSGDSASSDWVAYNDDLSNNSFIDMGITSMEWSNSQWTVGGPGSAYLYTGNADLTIGTNSATNYVSLFTGGPYANNERVRITPTGNVGIGNTAPDATLAVTGTANVSGDVHLGGNLVLSTLTAIIANGSMGANGTALFSNGTAVYWTNPASEAAGSNTQVTFNDSGVANGSGAFTFDYTSNTLSIENANIYGSATLTEVYANGSAGALGQALHSNGTAVYWANVSVVAGSNTQIQFNAGTDLGASANLTFDTDTDVLYVGNSINLGGVTVIGGSNTYSVVIGNTSAWNNSADYRVAIGTNAGSTGQQQSGVAIGTNAGSSGQQEAVAIGVEAGYTNQRYHSIAIGSQAGRDNQYWSAVAIGRAAGSNGQLQETVAIGHQAAANQQQAAAIAIGAWAGYDQQGLRAVAIGSNTGWELQGQSAVAIGDSSGKISQGEYSVALGAAAGFNSQSPNAIAIGLAAGYVSQGTGAIAIGTNAGQTGQGNYAIAIGYLAGNNTQAAQSIILNANGTELDTTNPGLYIDPIRNASTSQILYYNTSTKEVSYGTSVDFGAANTITVGNSTVNTVINASSITVKNIFSNGTINAAAFTINGNLTANSMGLFLNNGGSINAASITGTSLTVDGNATVTGNLTVQGTLTTIDTTQVAIADINLKLASNNAADLVDFGFYGQYKVAGNTYYSGLFRDHTLGDATHAVYHLYSTPNEPGLTAPYVVDQTNGYSLSTLMSYLDTGKGFAANATNINITANSSVAVSITANTLHLSSPLEAASGGTGLATYLAGDIIFASGTYSGGGQTSTTLTTLSVPIAAANDQILMIKNNLPAYSDTIDGGTF